MTELLDTHGLQIQMLVLINISVVHFSFCFRITENSNGTNGTITGMDITVTVLIFTLTILQNLAEENTVGILQELLLYYLLAVCPSNSF